SRFSMSAWMKPKPFVELKNFKIPVFTKASFQSIKYSCANACMRPGAFSIDFERRISSWAQCFCAATKFDKQDRWDIHRTICLLYQVGPPPQAPIGTLSCCPTRIWLGSL